MTPPAVIVMAKAPRAGRVKTRLNPPLSLVDAASIARAALIDTLRVVLDTPADRRLLALDGATGPWLPPGIDVIPQVDGDFAARLSGALAAVGCPALIIGMDTPQVTPALLTDALGALSPSGHDAVIGLTEDGGWWALGVRRCHPSIFDNVPMSSAFTGAAQMQRLRALDLRVSMLPTLRDIDHWPDVAEVVRDIPGSELARAVASLDVLDAAI